MKNEVVELGGAKPGAKVQGRSNGEWWEGRPVLYSYHGTIKVYDRTAVQLGVLCAHLTSQPGTIGYETRLL